MARRLKSLYCNGIGCVCTISHYHYNVSGFMLIHILISLQLLSRQYNSSPLSPEGMNILISLLLLQKELVISAIIPSAKLVVAQDLSLFWICLLKRTRVDFYSGIFFVCFWKARSRTRKRKKRWRPVVWNIDLNVSSANTELPKMILQPLCEH